MSAPVDTATRHAAGDYVDGAPTPFFLDVPGQPGRRIGQVALELPRDRFVGLAHADNEHYAEAAELAHQRLRRCKPGSPRWTWYQAVVGEHGRRRRSSLVVIEGGGST